ncbi:MAG: preprotein translocase subunit SecY [Myxococcales bacterium]|nr:preprotein translocase subunit SecY [Myxococcales bacterium]MCB9519901.1 preprotein translocase subunit SecY [Myxococcales bacterium]MCB9533192.1 preprotein translocase subunit SecY [Myxococcales bacterium]
MSSTIATIAKLPELRNRILFTVGLLAVYRLGIFVTTPGVDRTVMAQVISAGSGFLGLFNLFSGGALQRLSVFALGIMPYVSASIILQLLAVVVPSLERMRKEGEQGQKKINQYTRYGTVLLSIVQGTGIAMMLENMNDSYPGLVADPGVPFRLMTILSLTTGTAFLMWLGEQINERGIGNGISMIIFGGIVAGLPGGVISTMQAASSGNLSPLRLVALGALVLGVIFAIVFFETANRRIPVQYAKSSVGRKVYDGKSSYLPLKLNTAGVIPPIFASSLLIFPTTVAGYFPNSAWSAHLQAMFQPTDWRYNVIYVLLIIFFTFFYTAVTVNPVEMADNMQRGGSIVPGYRQGRKTAEYIDFVLTRISMGGALYLAAVCVLPVIVQGAFPAVNFHYGGTSLLIVVSVGLQTVQEIEGYLINRHYEGLTGASSTRIRERLALAD